MNRELFARLGNPEAGLNFIHVAGTNGKGSTCAMLDSVLRCAGYRVGLYTSPHLENITERVKINGVEISQSEWDELYERVDSLCTGLDVCEFDKYTAIGFLKFKKESCDIVVLEVGLGGRLDATNVIETPLVSVIASIGLEHTEILGDTIEKIAFEKAGIIKDNRPVIVQEHDERALNVFKSKAESTHSDLIISDSESAIIHGISLDGQVLSYKSYKGIRLSLLGSYQLKNVCLVLDTITELKTQGYIISDEAVKDGLSKVSWPGRFEVLRKSPLVIIDGAHNANGAFELAESIKAYLPGKKIHFVMGVLADKNYEEMLRLTVPFAKAFSVVSPDSERALSADRLKDLIESKYKIPTDEYEDAASAVKAITTHQDFKEIVIVFGSLYQVSSVRKLFL